MFIPIDRRNVPIQPVGLSSYRIAGLVLVLKWRLSIGILAKQRVANPSRGDSIGSSFGNGLRRRSLRVLE